MVSKEIFVTICARWKSVEKHANHLRCRYDNLEPSTNLIVTSQDTRRAHTGHCPSAASASRERSVFAERIGLLFVCHCDRSPATPAPPATKISERGQDQIHTLHWLAKNVACSSGAPVSFHRLRRKAQFSSQVAAGSGTRGRSRPSSYSPAMILGGVRLCMRCAG